MRTHPSDRDIQLCLYCPTLCLSRCPVAQAGGNITFSPWGKQSSVWRLNQGLVEPGPENHLPAYMCLDCLACREACDHDVDVPGNLAAARVELARKHESIVPVSAVAWDEEESWRLLRDVAPAWRRVEQCQALLIPGRELLQEDSIGLLEATFKALDGIGDMVVGINRDSVLECGHHAYAHAHYALAKKRAKKARKRFGRYGKLLFASPHCASFVQLKWPEIDLDRSRQATTVLEYVGKKLDFANGGFITSKVIYHDPCHFGRHLGLYQIPRDILKWAANSRPLEFLHSRNRSLCCGGGYPLPTIDSETADGVTELAVRQFTESGAELLVTSCGQCWRRFRQALGDQKVLHIFEILAEARK
jgi:Fe-S oxidoreductase